jgi:hypothetical protein
MEAGARRLGRYDTTGRQDACFAWHSSIVLRGSLACERIDDPLIFGRDIDFPGEATLTKRFKRDRLKTFLLK